MKLDKEVELAIMRQIKQAVQNVIEQSEEVYVTGRELSKRLQMFTPNWLKSYGHLLPRTQAVITHDNGQTHVTGWCYPLHKIQRMVEDGEIKRLRYVAK